MDNSDGLYLEFARKIGFANGTCSRRNVGAVLVAGGRVRETGWNGMERSVDAPTCMIGACPRGMLSLEEQPRGSGYSNCIYLHAEYNVLENYRLSANIRNQKGWATGIRVYTSSNPCEDCCKYSEWAGSMLVWQEEEL